MKTIWSTRGNIDKILDLPVDQKRLELTNWYDQEMVDQLADDELDQIIEDNADAFYDEAMEDFEYRIAPMISNQFLGGFVLDENFNVVDPGVLLNDAREDCEIYEDNNGDLYWKEEGRKAFPLLGFDEIQDKFIDQLDQLDILSTMHNLYPDQDDEDIEIYDIADLIPFDWALLGNVLNHAKNDLDVVEELTEAKAKNPNKLADELEEIKDLSEEYGREYFTQMPFTSYDNDPISIEVQYPEFFRVVKSFFKEMGILEGSDLEDSDTLDMSWDQDISQHDWDVLMRACDKLVQGKGVQFEKEYKTGYNSVLDDDEILASREQDESLNEDVRFYVDGGDVVDSLKDDRAIGTLYDDGTVELFDVKSVSKADREKIKKDLSNHYYVSFLDDINPELYKPFGHDSYDSGYIHEPEMPDWYDPEEDEPSMLPPDADDEDWEDDLDESAATDKGRHIARQGAGWIHNELYRLSDAVDQLNKRKSLHPGEKEAAKAIIDVANDIRRDLIDDVNEENLNEDTATWPWGDPDTELPTKKAEIKDSSDIDKYL